ncbi:MAG: SURF1 family protein [Duganella sp.]
MPIAFRFKPIPLLATVLVVALGIALGNWQARRADEKIATQQRLAQGAASAPLVLNGAPLAAADVEFRRVRVTGQFVRHWPLYLDNRPYQGRAGVYLLMPFRIEGSGMHVLVQRGWMARDPLARDKLPGFDTPAGTVTLDGVARQHTGHVMELGEGPALAPGVIVQNTGPLQVARASGLKMLPFVLQQGAPAQPGGDDVNMGRAWPASGIGPEKHQGYAFQWYALSAMAVVFFVVNGYRRGKPEN